MCKMHPGINEHVQCCYQRLSIVLVNTYRPNRHVSYLFGNTVSIRLFRSFGVRRRHIHEYILFYVLCMFLVYVVSKHVFI
jgi:hypothetical protein